MDLGRLLFLFFVGVLSVFFAEVLSGSSPLWFLDPFGYIILIPLYLFHVLILFNFAVSFNRLSSRSLYLFGVLFGLYETWMTKVAWAGFVGSESPIIFLGFALVEIGIVVLFWHPFMSFIAPLIAIRVFVEKIGANSSFNPFGVDEFRRINKVGILFFYLLAVFSSSVVLVNVGFNLFVALLSVGGNLLIILGLWFLLNKKYRYVLSFDSLLLGRKGLFFAFIYLVLIYAIFSIFYRPEVFPGPLTISLTILFYLLVIFLIYLDKPKRYSFSKIGNGEFFNINHLFRFWVFVISLIVILFIFRPLCYLLLITTFLTLVVSGFVIFIYTILLILLASSHS